MTACSVTRRTLRCSSTMSLPSKSGRYRFRVGFEQCSQKLITAAAACACTRLHPSSIVAIRAGSTSSCRPSCRSGPKSVHIWPTVLMAAQRTRGCSSRK